MSQVDVGTSQRPRRRPDRQHRSRPGRRGHAPATRPAWQRMISTSPFYMGCVLLALIIVFSILRPDSFPTIANVRNITLDVAMLQIMAVGMTFVMVGGGFDISIGSVLVFSGWPPPSSWTAVRTPGGRSPAGSSSASSPGGLLNGFCIAKLRVPPLITTLGTLGARSVRRSCGRTARTSAPSPRRCSPSPATALRAQLAGVARHRRDDRLRTDPRPHPLRRHTYLIGSNIESARRGINVNRHVIKLYALNAPPGSPEWSR